MRGDYPCLDIISPNVDVRGSEELTQIYIEKYQKDWLRKEAEKKKLSIAAIVRNIIDYFLKNEKEE